MEALTLRAASTGMFWPANVVDVGVSSSEELLAADASLASFWYSTSVYQVPTLYEREKLS